METKKAIEILRRHNAWRRGAELPMEDPTELGEAIDAVCDAIVSDFPEGITDEQIIWQAVSRDLLREVAKQMSDAVLIDELNKRLKRYGLQR